MKANLWSLTIGFLFAIGQTYSQESIRPLKKGEEMPNLKFKLYQSADESKVIEISLKDLRGKMILFDLWGLNCPSCIMGMPDMAEIQERFKGDVEVILVASEGVKEISEKWNKRFKSRKVLNDAMNQLKFITGDSLFVKLFPHQGRPLHVWIDKNGLFRYMTEAESATAENLSKFICGEQVKIREYVYPEYSSGDMSTWNNKEFQKKIGISSSVIYGKANLIGTIIKERDSITGKIVEVCIYNGTIRDFYSIAYGEWIPQFPSVSDIAIDTRFIIDDDVEHIVNYPLDKLRGAQWSDSNFHSYYLKVSPESGKDIFQIMRSDITRYFGIRSEIKVTRVKTIVLMTSDSTKRLVPTGSTSTRKVIVDEQNNMLHYQNILMKDLAIDLMQNFRELYSSILFIDETSYKGRVSISLPYDPDRKKISLQDLQPYLLKFGLSLKEEERLMDMIVISGLDKRG